MPLPLPSERLADMWFFEVRPQRPWNVPKRSQHSGLDDVLKWVQKSLREGKQCSDYRIIRLLSQAKPANDFTYLCQCLGFDGAAEGLSGTWSTLTAIRHDWDIDELFEELLPKLQSRAANQSFHDMCGKVNPQGGWHKECRKAFQRLDKEWKQRTEKHSASNTGKYYLRRSPDHALYVLIFHPDLNHTLYQNYCSNPRRPYCNGYESIWAHVLAEDPTILDELYKKENPWYFRNEPKPITCVEASS